MFLKQFISCYLYFPAPQRPNTTPKFHLVDPSSSLLKQSPSPFNKHVCTIFLHPYKRLLTSQLILILRLSALLGYQELDASIISRSLSFALFNSDIIKQKLDENLLLGRIIHTTQTKPFIFLSLGLVPKPNRDLWYIHHLSFPQESSVNDYIPKEVENFKYTTLENILTRIH